MRPPALICLILLQAQIFAQPAKGAASVAAPDVLCAELFAAIRANPQQLVMRLEEALVINESCTPELVKSAVEAVNRDPALTRKIVETALEISPNYSAAIRNAAVEQVSAPVELEIRRAMVADVPMSAPVFRGEEVRRAEVPLRIPFEEVRRAVVPASDVLDTNGGAFNLMNVPKAVRLKSGR
jgi:hypothetical protein